MRWTRAVLGTFAASILFATTFAGRVRADILVEIRNGDTVTGTTRPAAEEETFFARIPAQSPLSITLKGLKQKGKPPVAAPAVTFRVLDDGGTDIAAGKLVQAATSAKVAGPAELVFQADAGSTATLSVKAAAGSTAHPRLDHLTGTGLDVTLTPTVPATSVADKQSNVQLGAGGEIKLRAVDAAAAGGAFSCSIALKDGKPRALNVSAAILDASFAVTGSAFGSFVGTSGGVVAVPDTVVSPISGASVTIPAGSLAAATSILVGSAPPVRSAERSPARTSSAAPRTTRSSARRAPGARAGSTCGTAPRSAES